MSVELSFRHTSPKELQIRLEEFEERYGVPSSRLAEAFRSSPLRETPHFREWSALYAAWQVSNTQR